MGAAETAPEQGQTPRRTGSTFPARDLKRPAGQDPVTLKYDELGQNGEQLLCVRDDPPYHFRERPEGSAAGSRPVSPPPDNSTLAPTRPLTEVTCSSVRSLIRSFIHSFTHWFHKH